MSTLAHDIVPLCNSKGVERVIECFVKISFVSHILLLLYSNVLGGSTVVGLRGKSFTST